MSRDYKYYKTKQKHKHKERKKYVKLNA